MINRIIEWSAKYRIFVLLIAAGLMLGAWWAMHRVPVDAIPDLSDTQVIVYSQWDRSPDILEDQVTYPIISALLGMPNVKTIRGFSDFGYSYVYVIFKDGTDLYWARARVLEYLNKILPQLPKGVSTELGPDATSVGWVYQYALIDKSNTLNLGDLRSLQDWFLRPHLQSIPGVSEVAPIGGFVKQYQITLDPVALLAYQLTLFQVIDAVQKSNTEVGGRLLDISGTEYMIRGRGYIQSVEDIKQIGIGVNSVTGTPITIGQVAQVSIGPDIRRGVADLNGEGDTVVGTIVMRHGENALSVIERVKTKLHNLKSALPNGVQIVPVYDRSELIQRAIHTLRQSLIEEMIIVSIVIFIFLWHVPSAVVPILTIPISVVLAFIPLYFLGITSNIMSLAGIAISIGILVDGAIIMVENSYKRLGEWKANGQPGSAMSIQLNALKEVAPSVFFALLVITVSFLPIFALVDQEGRLFKPLAFTKTVVMAISAVLAITVVPAVMVSIFRDREWTCRPKWLAAALNKITVGRFYSEEQHPISRWLHQIYEPVCRWTLNYRKTTMGIALLLMVATIPMFRHLGSEFMPPLNEGAMLYMPTGLPGMSVGEAQRVLQLQDRVLKSFPEVESVFGKSGRAGTSTDPAPFSMFETTVVLKPKSEWPISKSYDELKNEMNAKLAFPGLSNVWTMPIKNRIDMLATGIRTPVGIKIFGPDLAVIQQLGTQTEQILGQVRGTESVIAERTAGGYYLDVIPNRTELSRLGMTIDDLQSTIGSAVGGESIGTVLQGRERYGISVRYARDFRQNIDALKRVLVASPTGLQVPLGQVAELKMTEGPAMIRDENGQLAGYVYIDVSDSDIGGYVTRAKSAIDAQLTVPKGYVLEWSGQYENMARVKSRLLVIVPITLVLIFLLLYLNTRSLVKTAFILMAVPFSLIGAVWLMFALGYHLSIAAWVGMIALLGLDAETGVFMLLFLDLAYQKRKESGHLNSEADLKDAIVEGAVKRVRPKMMTVTAAFLGLLPLMWSMGTGADVMKRIAAPMVGGLLTSFLLELLIYPVVFYWWKRNK